MELKIGCKFLHFILFLILFAGFILLCSSNILKSAPNSMVGSDILNTKGSTNPGSPILLSNDVQIYDYYNSTYYYYRTSTMASFSYYHVFWLQPIDIDDDFNLNLYSDSSYSVLCATSTRGAGALDWVVVRPSSSQYYYPRVHSYSGIGYAYIEWESSSSSLSIGTPITGSLDTSECIEVYMVSLSAGVSYNFTLDVPNEADYDLYLYYLASGGANNSNGALRSSMGTGLGLDETIGNYRCSFTSNCILIITRQIGSGSFTLYSYSQSTISLTDETAVLNSYSDSFSYYYYQTSAMASSSYYHVFWLQPTDVDDDFNLNLYSDTSYFVPRATSTRGAGKLDWVVVRPGGTQYYYPRGHRYSGIGSTYVEWEAVSYTITIGSPVSVSLSASECIEAYRVSLSTGTTYAFTLDVPSGADYDLYLYYLAYGGATNSSGALKSSTMIGLGLDESITDYQPSLTGYHILLVTRQIGTGTYTLNSYSRGIISLTDEYAYSESYSSSFSSYYYMSNSASSSYYHTFWLQPTDIDDDFNLYLYSNSGYSILSASSTRGAGALDWVVIRPSSTQYYYPRGHRNIGIGTATIEWESSSAVLSIGTPVSASLGSSECIEIYMVYLCNFLRYNFSLSVPDTADYDLYIYYLPSGGSTNISSYMKSSDISGYGFDEAIQNFSPISSDYYAIFVVRKAGSGYFTLLPSGTVLLLADDNSIYNLYNSTDSYYYQTSTIASSPYYHTFWLQPTDVNDNFNLYLYSDSGYSVLRASSTSGAGALDWVVIRPGSSQYYYPRVYSYSGIGYGYIEWESGSSTLSIGTPISASLNISACIEIYGVYLTSGVNYNFTLDLPDGADYDLYLYYLSSGAATNQSGAIRSSATIGSGIDEKIDEFRAAITDYYILAVIRQDGSGPFTLYSYSSNMVSLTDESAVYQTYNASFLNYYYQTNSIASSSYYHVFWLQPIEIDDEFNLYLYSDSGYSNLQAASTGNAEALNWVLVRPNSSQYYYPKIYRNSGIGSAYIEWEVGSSSLPIGYPTVGALSSSECIEAYMISLSTSNIYNFILDVPETADYDFYLYHLNSGTAINQSGFIKSSTTLGSLDEYSMQYSPQISGDHLVLVVRRSGTGTYTLYCSSNTTYLYDKYAFYEYYNASLPFYYYQTSTTASSSYYHVFWLQPVDINDDFNLYLYSNSGYSILQAASTSSVGALDWVIVRPSSSQYYYPKTHRNLGIGSAYIEWDAVSSPLSNGYPSSGVLSPSECIEAYRISLSTSYTYNFHLDVPDGADFDLYLYYLNSGSGLNQSGFVSSSRNLVNFDESILQYRPLISSDYLVLVVRRSGTGTFTLYSSSNTTYLYDEYAFYDYYSSLSSYYYQTNGAPSTAYYHVIWVQPTQIEDDFNLYLYSNSGYSTLSASSTRSASALDWVVFRPSSVQSYYPKVQRNLGAGYAFIEWEAGSSPLTIGIPLSGSLNYSECIEIYSVYLSAGTPYNFTLDVPSGADYDLYLYYFSSGSAISWNNYVRSSTNSGSGIDEKIANYYAVYTDYYLILVIRNYGMGTFSLSCVSNARILLYNDSELVQSYGSSYTNVYYRTSNVVSSAYYQVVWLQPYYADDDFDLYLFSDNSYSNFKASSTTGDGCLDWVIFCSSSPQYYYPMVDTKADTGFAFIEWEDGSSYISSGSYVSGDLAKFDCIELYQVTLSTSEEYDLSLSVPDGCDFDLYLYFLNAGSAVTGSSVYLNASVHLSMGYDESIDDFKPPKSGTYAILVVWKSGFGSYNLRLDSGNAPSDPLNLVIIVLLIIVSIAIIGVSVVAIYKHKEIWASPPTSSQPAPSAPAMGSESNNKPKAYKQSERSKPPYPQILKQHVRSFDYYCLHCGRLVRAGKKCQNCSNGSDNHMVS